MYFWRRWCDSGSLAVLFRRWFTIPVWMLLMHEAHAGPWPSSLRHV